MSTRFPEPRSREDRLDELEGRVRRLEEALLERPASSRESGTPMTLFIAFVFYGGALLLVPRLMSRGPSEGR